MYKIKWIWFLLISVFFAHCKIADIPKSYNFTIKEIQNNTYGCWTEIITNTTLPGENTISVKGELLALETDSIYLLIADGEVRAVGAKAISTAKLYTHKNQSNSYLVTTILLAIPGLIGAIAFPEYSGNFLVMIIPSSLIGFSQVASENEKKGNILFFPGKNDLKDFRPYARYPGGMPEIIDYRLLYLKK